MVQTKDYPDHSDSETPIYSLEDVHFHMHNLLKNFKIFHVPFMRQNLLLPDLVAPFVKSFDLTHEVQIARDHVHFWLPDFLSIGPPPMDTDFFSILVSHAMPSS